MDDTENDMPSFEMLLTEDIPIETNKEPTSRNLSSQTRRKNVEDRTNKRRLFTQQEMDDSIEFFEDKEASIPKKKKLKVTKPSIQPPKVPKNFILNDDSFIVVDMKVPLPSSLVVRSTNTDATKKKKVRAFKLKTDAEKNLLPPAMWQKSTKPQLQFLAPTKFAKPVQEEPKAVPEKDLFEGIDFFSIVSEDANQDLVSEVRPPPKNWEGRSSKKPIVIPHEEEEEAPAPRSAIINSDLDIESIISQIDLDTLFAIN